MKKAFVLVAMVSLVLFVSGCVEGTGFGEWMGVGAEEREEPDDVLSIDNERVSPSTVNEGDIFEFSFELSNLFERESAENVDVRLYDSGRCDNETDRNPIDGDSIFEGATRVVEWEFQAPEDISVTRTCDLHYDVKYDFDAHTTSDFYIMGEDVSRDDEVAQVSPSVGKARGPLKIDISFSGEQPFRNGTTIPFQIVLKNAGDGKLDDLNPEDVNITLDYGDEDHELGVDEYLDEDDGWEDEKTGCIQPMGEADEDEEYADFRFIDSQTPPISCRLYPDDDQGYSDNFTEPLSSFSVDVDVEDYRYTLQGSRSVTIHPTL